MPGNKPKSKYVKKRRSVGIRRQDITKGDSNEESPYKDNSTPGMSSTPNKMSRSLYKVNEHCPISQTEREEILTWQKPFELGSTSNSSCSLRPIQLRVYIQSY